MEKEKYKEIRGKSNFLYLYFLEMGGKGVSAREFPQMLALWIQMTMGVTPSMGMAEITKYLDEKHK